LVRRFELQLGLELVRWIRLVVEQLVRWRRLRLERRRRLVWRWGSELVMVTRPQPEPVEVLRDDVDEIIGIAAKHANATADKLTISELVDIGAELGLDRDAVERATKELEERRRAERAAAEKRHRLERKAAVAAGIGVVGLLLVFFVSSLAGRSSLSSHLTEVEEARSQVDNVVRRRAEVDARLAHATDMNPDDRNAELAGAENRVAVEKRRYDEAATRYNAAAISFPGSLSAKLFALPIRVPLSRESSSW
jgi:hypothetical protein